MLNAERESVTNRLKMNHLVTLKSLDSSGALSTVFSSNTRQTLLALDGQSRQTLFLHHNLCLTIIHFVLPNNMFTLWTEISNITLRPRKLSKEIANIFENRNTKYLPLELQAIQESPEGHHFLFHL
jgi:hypothetical protein